MGWIAGHKLRKISKTKYWKNRKSRIRMYNRFAIWHARLLFGTPTSRLRIQKNSNFIASNLMMIALAVLTIAMFELLAKVLSKFWSELSIPVFIAPTQGNSNSVSDLLTSTVAMAATILGLYFATIGVISSTVYKSVPGDVRDLFISERTNGPFLKYLIFTISSTVFGLVAETLGYRLAGITLALLGLTAATTCIGLIVVTRKLFDFFDPSKLASPLTRQLLVSFQIASRKQARDNRAIQTLAHITAVRSLVTYRHIVDLISDKKLRNATGPVNLSRQLIALADHYSLNKHKIPTNSQWWNRVPKHQNWLTPKHSELELAMNSNTFIPPDLLPDYLWFENRLLRLLEKTLDVAFRAQAGADALAISEQVADLVCKLAARLQIAEALAMEEMWCRVAMKVTDTSNVANVDAKPSEIIQNQMAAAESLVRPRTMMLLGLTSAAKGLISRDLSTEFQAAIENPAEIYRGTLPTETRKILEQFATAIKKEIETEGKRITPQWWVNHFAARSLSEAFLATWAGIYSDINSKTLGPIQFFQSMGRTDLAAVAGMSSLELLNKIETHDSTIQNAELHLKSFENANTSNSHWPNRSEVEFDWTKESRSLLRKLSELISELRQDQFNSEQPDLYGQLYQFVVDGAFGAILDGDLENGLILYRTAIEEMDAARIRVLADLDNNEIQTRLVHALEPIITAMDLAGYSLLMQEMDSIGIWVEVKELWNQKFQKQQNLADSLLLVANYLDGTFGFTTGGLERTRRSIKLGQIFENRNLGSKGWDFWSADDKDNRVHSSPIVSAFAPGGYGIQDDLYALFIAEFLVHYLPLNTDLGYKAKMVQELISRYRHEGSD